MVSTVGAEAPKAKAAVPPPPKALPSAAPKVQQPAPEPVVAQPQERQQPQAQPTAQQLTQQAPAAGSTGLFGWIGSFFSWFSGSKSTAPAAPAEGDSAGSSKTVAFLDRGVPEREQGQDPKLVKTWTLDQRKREIFIGDAFGAMEQEDTANDEQFRRKDLAARVSAETPAAPHHPAPGAGADPLVGGMSHASSFWATMSEEDADIEDSLNEGKDLARFEKLTRIQNAQVQAAASSTQRETSQIGTDSKHDRGHGDTSFAAGRISDTWQGFEAQDHAEVERINKDPTLQMLQLHTGRLRKAGAAAA